MADKRIMLCGSEWGYAELLAREIHALLPAAVIGLRPRAVPGLGVPEGFDFAILVTDDVSPGKTADSGSSTSSERTPAMQMISSARGSKADFSERTTQGFQVPRKPLGLMEVRTMARQLVTRLTEAET